jgi:hypothetical protein
MENSTKFSKEKALQIAEALLAIEPKFRETALGNIALKVKLNELPKSVDAGTFTSNSSNSLQDRYFINPSFYEINGMPRTHKSFL